MEIAITWIDGQAPKRNGGKAAKGCRATGGQAADCPNMSGMGGLLLLAGLSESPEL